MSSNPSGSLPPDQARHGQPPPRSPEARSRPAPKDKASTFTRAGALWGALIMGFLVLILLLIFVTQNIEAASFTFFSWHWSLPKGVALLLAAIGGGLLTFAVGTARILQLRSAAKKNLAAAVR